MEQLHGHHIFMADLQTSKFYIDPFCCNCASDPFILEGTWDPSVENEVYLDELQFLFRPIGKKGDVLKHEHYIGHPGPFKGRWKTNFSPKSQFVPPGDYEAYILGVGTHIN